MISNIREALSSKPSKGINSTRRDKHPIVCITEDPHNTPPCYLHPQHCPCKYRPRPSNHAPGTWVASVIFLIPSFIYVCLRLHPFPRRRDSLGLPRYYLLPFSFYDEPSCRFFFFLQRFILGLVILSVISSVLSVFYLVTSFNPSHLITPSGVRLENRWEESVGSFVPIINSLSCVQSLSTESP